ncbi:hypothetical protein [Vibrio phage JSF13]|uniref:hypothetical protein n=1 Tax=Vibrio cholerae TaxID=666 RepID=UPI0001FF8D23|nr:hypothetical protein TUST1-191_00800 [Vibrio phage ICP1_2006_D]ADX88433.1 hypothetical protein TUST1-182_00800 [Vibrio phage ICP1_2006_C]ADX88657.1 hypothetical protein TUST1-159_00785 [Vibrio phage ICP1_2006_B]ADX88883.1 hypothetical protein TUST1-17_00785 [Vibrio phage ICP1_2006_A]ADX89114.1 hypothetical protein TUST1-15_00810 [Vibrio phage ICP1_2005_A]ADX89571.1 hypothetical protein TUST1-10_00795 [Vibrio phage ICP1_2004_A]ASV41246.1 hypothetical protein [Vibrio phage JSF5]ASV41481.1 h
MKETVGILEKIKRELRAFSVEIRYGDAFDNDGEHTFLSIAIYTEMLDNPIEIDINLDKVLTGDINIDTMLEELKFELDCSLNTVNFYSHYSERVH